MKLTRLEIILLSIASFGILSGLIFYHLKSQAYIGELKVSYTQDKSLVLGGENITYTLAVENKYENSVSNAVAGVSVDPYADYVAGSSFYTVGGNTYNIPDSWIADRFNMGNMDPFQKNSITYQVKIKPAAPTNAVISSIGQAEADGIPAAGDEIHATVIGTTALTAFQTGDVYLGANVTAGENDWHDPVGAAMGNVINYKFRLVNQGQFDATDIRVRAQLPWDPQNLSSQLISTATATADNISDSLSDTMAVNLSDGIQSYLWPYDGHYSLLGITTGPDGYDCPQSCPINNQFLWEPMAIGNLEPGASVEILFKASVFNIAPTTTPTLSPTPTPTTTPTGTPIPTPTAVPPELACIDLHVIAGTTTRSLGESIEFQCVGSDQSQVKNCRFRFGDGAAETFDPDCKVSHAYSAAGNYDVSCEVQDQSDHWQAAAACGDNLQVAAGPTAAPSAGEPTPAGVTPAPLPSQQPKTGFGAVWFAVLAALGIAIKLLLAI